MGGVIALLASGAYLINHSFGIPGVSVLNDFASHLVWAEALRTHASPFSVIAPGYPLGPFAVAGTVGELPGVGVSGAFHGLLIVTPVLTALTSLVLFARLHVLTRLIAAAVVALAYLALSATMEGAFKEPIAALFTLGIATTLQRYSSAAATPRRRAAAVPLAILVAGSVTDYSYPGLAWPGLTIIVWLVLEAWRRRRTVSRALIHSLVGPVSIALLVFVVAVAPEGIRFREFQHGQVATLASSQVGNIPTALPPTESLGIWFSDDFRFASTQSITRRHLMSLFAILVLSFGVVSAWRRRDTGILAFLVAAIAVAVYGRHAANIYYAAKPMMVLSVAIAVVSVRGLLPGDDEGQRTDSPGRRRLTAGGLAMAATGVVFAALTLWSSSMAIRGAQIGPRTHSRELDALRPMLVGHTVLFLAQDDFSAWELRGTRLSYVSTYTIKPQIPFVYRTTKPFVPDQPVDFDSFDADTLDRFQFVVLPRTSFNSVPPMNWHLVASTTSYEVWERVGPTLAHAVLPEVGGPGALLICTAQPGQDLRRSAGLAVVRAEPIVASGSTWVGAAVGRAANVTELDPGTGAVQDVTVPAGTWEVSLQYTSPTGLTLRAPGLSAVLPAVLEHQGPYWAAGTMTSTGRPVKIEIDVHRAAPLALNRHALLGSLTLVSQARHFSRIPLRAACGRYVDWYAGA